MSSFEEQDYKGKVKLSTWKVIFKAVFSDKKNVIGMLIFIVVLSVLDIIYPLFNKIAIDDFFVKRDFTNFTPFMIVYSLIGVLFGISVYGFIRFAGNVEASTSYNLRRQAYEKLQKLSFSYYDRTPQGWVMARMTSDARKLADIISWGAVDFFWGILNMIGILVILMVVNFQLSLIVICLLPFLLGFAIICRKKILKHHRNARRINSQITASYNEGFMGSKTTKSLVIESENEKEFSEMVFSYRRSALRAVFFSALFGPVIFFLGYLGVSITIYVGGNLVLLGLSIGTLYLFIDYTIKFFDPVMQISRILSDFQNAQASAERIVALIETSPEIIDSEEVIKKYGTLFEPIYENWEEMKGDIEFKNVTFKYNEGETVLNRFNLSVKAGQMVALVGHTGSGKSTIVNLLCRFYEPSSGTILIDGIDYKKRSVGWLHKNLGYVLQTPQLFSGTVIENIRYGNLCATDEEVYHAAKVVDADRFITKLDNGYNTDIGEGGNKLSLGQKQLISFARAIIANPKILVLDEATSSIDTLTEEQIQSAISVVMEGRTSFAVAHRLSTIVNADLILVLDEGKIVEMGKHDELLDKKGFYFELYKNQFLKELEEKIA